MSTLRIKKRTKRGESPKGAESGRAVHGHQNQRNLNRVRHSWIVRILRWLDPIFFWSSLFFLAWLLVDLALRSIIPFGASLVLRVVAVPIAAILGPLAVGYWSAWLSMHMIFYPIEKNMVWQGILPAHSRELLAAVAQVLKEHLLTEQTLQRYMKDRRILPELLPRIAEMTDSTTGEKDFRQALRSILRDWIRATLERDDARQVLKDTTGKIIGAWRAEHFIDKPMEWSKKLWGPWVQEKVLEAFPAIPDAMVGATDELEPWLQQLSETLRHKGAPIDVLIAQGLSTGIQSLEIEALVDARLKKDDMENAVNSVREQVCTEVRGVQVVGGVLGLCIGLGMRIAILRIVFLVLFGGVYLLLRFTKENE